MYRRWRAVLLLYWRNEGYCDSGSEAFTWRFTVAGQPTDSSSCSGFGTPNTCCTGPGTGTCPYVPYLGIGALTDFADIGASPIENVAHMCTLASTSSPFLAQTLVAPSIAITKNNSLDELFFGVVNSNAVGTTGAYGQIYATSIVGTGPAIGNDSESFGSATAATGNQTVITTQNPGNNIGYQVGLSPLP